MKMMLESVRVRLLLIPFAAAALTVGCGQTAMQSPTGPSSTSGSGTFLTDGSADLSVRASSAGEFGTLDKGGNGQGKHTGGDESDQGNGKKPEDAGDHGRSHEARVVGFVSANANGVLTVNGMSVSAGPGAVIRHGNRILTVADIHVGDHVEARGAMDGTTLVATEIKVQETDRDDDEEEPAGENTISGLSSTSGCPSLSFMVGTKQVNTNAGTIFENVTCAALANGAEVTIEGITQVDGSITATKVILQ